MSDVVDVADGDVDGVVVDVDGVVDVVDVVEGDDPVDGVVAIGVDPTGDVVDVGIGVGEERGMPSGTSRRADSRGMPSGTDAAGEPLVTEDRSGSTVDAVASGDTVADADAAAGSERGVVGASVQHPASVASAMYSVTIDATDVRIGRS